MKSAAFGTDGPDATGRDVVNSAIIATAGCGSRRKRYGNVARTEQQHFCFTLPDIAHGTKRRVAAFLARIRVGSQRSCRRKPK